MVLWAILISLLRLPRLSRDDKELRRDDIKNTVTRTLYYSKACIGSWICISYGFFEYRLFVHSLDYCFYSVGKCARFIYDNVSISLV